MTITRNILSTEKMNIDPGCKRLPGLSTQIPQYANKVNPMASDLPTKHSTEFKQIIATHFWTNTMLLLLLIPIQNDPRYFLPQVSTYRSHYTCTKKVYQHGKHKSVFRGWQLNSLYQGSVICLSEGYLVQTHLFLPYTCVPGEKRKISWKNFKMLPVPPSIQHSINLTTFYFNIPILVIPIHMRIHPNLLGHICCVYSMLKWYFVTLTTCVHH